MDSMIVFAHNRDGPQDRTLVKYLYFSDRELRIADLLSEGKSEAQIAEILKISQQQLSDATKRLKDRTLKIAREGL